MPYAASPARAVPASANSSIGSNGCMVIAGAPSSRLPPHISFATSGRNCALTVRDREPAFERGCRLGATEQESLRVIATVATQHVERGFILNAFGHHLEIEVVTEF